MGVPPDLKRIAKEDFAAQYQDLVDKLAFPLNSFMEQTRNLFTKNIDFQNLNQELITLRVQTDENIKPLAKPAFKSTLTTKVRGIVVLSASIVANGNISYIQQAPFISFSQNNNIISVDNISGLAAETTYDLLLLTIS